MHYINPYDLLEINAQNLSDIGTATINRAKRKLFAELELSDTNTITHSGAELNKGDCLRAIDDLDNRDKREFHFFIYQHKHLKRFLTEGKLSFFENYQTESIYKLPEFLDFFSQFFADQYDKILLENFKKWNHEAVAKILSIKPITNENYFEKCYKSAYAHVKEIDNEVNDIIRGIENKKSPYINEKFNGLDKELIAKVNVHLLNLLPTYFQSLRNQLALSIRNLATNINNDPYELYEPAYKAIEIANNISTDALTHQTVTRDYYIIKKNYNQDLAKLKAQKQASADIQLLSWWRKKVDEIEAITQEIKKGESNYIASDFNGLDKVVYEIIDTSKLNTLPNSFQSIRNELALTIRSLAATVNNVPHRKYKVAYLLISIAYSINADADITEKVSSVYTIIKRNFDKEVGQQSTKSNFDSDSQQSIHQEKKMKTQKEKTNWVAKYRNKRSIIYLLVVLVIILAFLGYQKSHNGTTTTSSPSVSNMQQVENSLSSSPSTDNSISYSPPDTSTYIQTEPPATPVEPVYSFPYMSNGNIAECPNIHPRYNKNIDNKLIISCGSNADVAVKMIDESTEKSIRYVYIHKNTTYTIRNIPEGRYYLKIAYGDGWGVKAGESNCEGRFTTDALYKKGDETLDYNLIYENNGNYQVPSYSLRLDVILTTNDDNNTFSTDQINENEFYNE